ncbi:MAG TPA: peptidoglycan DD-metalloendopeptidase family protein [Longilinea sp.]|nr:peptidoglycan DD-metalloendopeptidase family protein [Longilinea sp.]
MKQFRIIFLILLIVFLAVPFRCAAAQESTATENPVYIVQTGDTLSLIAARFGVSVNDIIQLNQITDPNIVSVGTHLSIPGLEGVSGVLTTTVIPLGQNMETLIRQYQLPKSQLVKLNRITSPAELYAGSALIITQSETEPLLVPQGSIATGQGLLSLAVSGNTNPWTLLLFNEIDEASLTIPNDILYRVPGDNENPSSPFSPHIQSIEISPLPLIQGTTAEIRVKTTETLTLSGNLNGRELHFFPVEDGYIALQGIHAMANTGPAPFELSGIKPDKESFSFQQNVLINSGNFAFDTRLRVDPATVDAANTGPEDEKVRELVAPATSERLWDGIFRPPVGVPAGYSMFPDCTTDRFGNRRAYNDGPYDFFHSGIDLSACENTLNIYAPAAGIVVFTGSLTVRGNYTVIDHGWGVYSGYGHQSEIKVKVGDRVEPGQLIGLIGNTGRVTGPHLHWEIWVNDVLVQPLDWVNKAYP